MLFPAYAMMGLRNHLSLYALVLRLPYLYSTRDALKVEAIDSSASGIRFSSGSGHHDLARLQADAPRCRLGGSMSTELNGVPYDVASVAFADRSMIIGGTRGRRAPIRPFR